MEQQPEQIREQQKESWNKSSPGWKKWDDLVAILNQVKALDAVNNFSYSI